MSSTTSPLIALTTDFGTGSHYVAQMKGVILSVTPHARLIDVTHGIAPQSIRHAETVLRSAAFCLPMYTVHVVVVDPGVGTARRPIAVRSRSMTFVGPDNGVLGVALQQPDARAVVLDRPELHRQPVSPTFHGRDIFAPVAAELAAGLGLDDVGTPITDPTPSTLPRPIVEGRRVGGEVLIADTFGNLLTNIPAESVDRDWTVRIGDREARWVTTYHDESEAAVLALVGSDGYVEIAVRDSSAAEALGAGPGTPVECTRDAGR